MTGDYHDLYLQTDTFLLADVFEKFRDKCIEIYGLDPSYFLSVPGLGWQADLKKDRSKTRIINLLLCVNQHIGILKKMIST